MATPVVEAFYGRDGETTFSSWSVNIPAPTNFLYCAIARNPIAGDPNQTDRVRWNLTELTRVPGMAGNRVDLFYLPNPDIGTYVLDILNDIYSYWCVGIYGISGVDLVTPIGVALNRVLGLRTAVDENIASSVDDLVIDTLWLGRTTPYATPDASQTQLHQATRGNNQGQGSSKIATGASTNMKWTFDLAETHYGGLAIKGAVIAKRQEVEMGIQVIREQSGTIRLRS